MPRDVPWPDGGPQVPGLLSSICPGMSRDVPWPNGGPQVPGLLSPICPGMSWDVLGCPGMSQGSFSPTDISGSSGPVRPGMSQEGSDPSSSMLS